MSRVSDPDSITSVDIAITDPDWIWIQSRQWITNTDPDPGGQKLPPKVEKN